MILQIAIPILFIGIGALLLIIGSLENLRWRFNISSSQQLWINLGGGVLVVIGIGMILLPAFLSDRQSRAAVVEPTEIPPPFINITEPNDSLDCTGTGSVCTFPVRGVGGGIAPPMDPYRVVTFVFPLEPLGSGNFIQRPFAIMEEDGSWEVDSASYGSSTLPAENGNRVRIVTALVSSNASLDGTPINQLPRDFYLGRVEDVEGIIAVSEPQDLTVVK